MSIPWNVYILRDWSEKGWWIIRDISKVAWFSSYDEAYKTAEKMK